MLVIEGDMIVANLVGAHHQHLNLLFKVIDHALKVEVFVDFKDGTPHFFSCGTLVIGVIMFSKFMSPSFGLIYL